MTAAAPSVGVPVPPRPSRAGRIGAAFGHNLPAVIVGVAALGDLGARRSELLDVRAFILPAPSAIGAALVENWGAGRWPLFDSAMATLFEAVGGLVIGTVVGIVIAFGVARWANARDAVLPFAVAANAIPIIAIAPIFNAWFGVTNPVSKMMIAALLVFFPVMINVTRGLTSVEPSALELMRSYAASEWTILRKLRAAERASLLPDRTQGGHHPEPHRRDRRRVLRWIIDRDRQSGGSVRVRPAIRRDMGRHLPGSGDRDHVLPADRRARAGAHPVARIGSKPGPDLTGDGSCDHGPVSHDRHTGSLGSRT